MGADRHVRNLIKIDDPTIGLFQKTFFDPLVRPFAPEQHLFHPVGFNRGRADRDERGAGTI